MHDALHNHAHILAWDHFSFPPLYNPAITTAECTIIKHLKSYNKDSARPFVGLDFCFFLCGFVNSSSSESAQYP